MPLERGGSRETVSKNIAELHTGKTYSRTKRKHGKKVADRQAVAISLSNARKTGKKKRYGRKG
jgi:hypothetical protein